MHQLILPENFFWKISAVFRSYQQRIKNYSIGYTTKGINVPIYVIILSKPLKLDELSIMHYKF